MLPGVTPSTPCTDRECLEGPRLTDLARTPPSRTFRPRWPDRVGLSANADPWNTPSLRKTFELNTYRPGVGDILTRRTILQIQPNI
jgi:hypothetical protein